MDDTTNKILLKISAVEEKIDKMATKADFDNVTNKIILKVLSIEEKMATKTDTEHLDKKIDEMLISTDRFVKLHETLDQELVMLRSKYLGWGHK